MAEETKKYLDYDGLAYLVEKLTNKIQASGGGSSWVPEPGAYVAYTDAEGVNRICKPSDWSSEGNTACGVLVVHGGGSLLVSLTQFYEEGGEVALSDTDSYGARTTSAEVAVNDLAGKWNTELALAMNRQTEYGTGTLAYSRSHHTCGKVGEGAWWLPSLGEIRIIHDNLDAVEECLSAAGGDSLFEYNLPLVSSTLYNGNGSVWAWNLKTNVLSHLNVEIWDAVARSVGRFAWVPDGFSGGGNPDFVEPIKVEPDYIESDGTTATVKVTSPTAWKVDDDFYFYGDYGWVSPRSGPAGVTEVEIGFDVSYDTSSFVCEVPFHDELGNTATLKVLYQPSEPEYDGPFEIEPSEVWLTTPSGMVQTLTVRSETAWWYDAMNTDDAEELDEYFEIEPHSGNAGVSEVTLTLKKYHESFTRTVCFTNEDDVAAYVTVHGSEYDE